MRARLAGRAASACPSAPVLQSFSKAPSLNLSLMLRSPPSPSRKDINLLERHRFRLFGFMEGASHYFKLEAD